MPLHVQFYFGAVGSEPSQCRRCSQTSPQAALLIGVRIAEPHTNQPGALSITSPPRSWINPFSFTIAMHSGITASTLCCMSAGARSDLYRMALQPVRTTVPRCMAACRFGCRGTAGAGDPFAERLLVLLNRQFRGIARPLIRTICSGGCGRLLDRLSGIRYYAGQSPERGASQIS